MNFIMPVVRAEEVERITTAQGVLDAFNRLVDFFTALIVILAIVFLIYNGFKFISARGDEKKIEEAKRGVLYGIVAVVLIILASSAFRIISDFINGSF